MRNRTITRKSRRSAAVVAATAAAILGSALVPQQTAEATAAQAAARTTSPPPDPEVTASKKAKETGKPVEVLARRTETSQLFANPSGTYTQEQYVLPRWTRQDDKLVPIDTTLARSKDGRIGPKATKAGISFSGGGSGPAVSIVHDGRKLSLSWPNPLPKPTTSGDTATYAEVLPGVDLRLRAGNAGFSQLLVVKTPEAAANPALKTIRFSMATDGVQVSADTHGNVTAVNAADQEVFTAPTPRMWDSSTSVSPGLAKTLSADTPAPPTDGSEPGPGAKAADLGLSVGKSSLALTPDQPLLTGADTTYPVYIDPTFSVAGSREAWAIAYKATPNTAYFNGAGWHNADGTVGTNLARAGYEDYTNGLGRSFFRMDSNTLWNTNKKIKSSTFRIKNAWSYSCQDRRVELWQTGGISSSTTWASQDNSTMWTRKLSHSDQSLGWGSGCPAGNLAFDVTAAANEAVTKRLNYITLGLRATNEVDPYSWKKFDAATAVLSTDYNTYPDAPKNLDTTPDTNAAACLAGPCFSTTLGNTDLTLSGTFSDPDGGTVKARFVLWPMGHGGPTNEVNQVVEVPSGKGAQLPILKTKLKQLLTDAGITGTGTFSWHARAEDGELTSDWTPILNFNFDATRPSFPPSVTSAEFPDGSDGWPETTGNARSEGTFHLKNEDKERIAAFEYWTDWDATVRKVSSTYLGVDIKLTPPSVGRHLLNVRAVDSAGNLSDTTRYWFYANGPGLQDKPGDLNGDGIADFYGVRTDGTLWFYGGQGNGIMTPYVVASKQKFNGANITRRGDWTQDGYEDLISLDPSTDGKTLTVYPNNGFGYACSTRYEQATDGSKSCLYENFELSVFDPNNNHWSDASEILAIGDVDGPLDTNADGIIDVQGHPDLLVKQGNLLWLYFGSANHYLDSSRAPVLIGSAGWSGYTLAAPGDRDKNGHVDLIARNTANGELFFYPGTGANGEGLANGTTATRIGTGWTTTNRPLITAVPDANGDGTSDIWTTGGDGVLYFYPNTLGTGVNVGSGGWTAFQDLS
ncbi:VCBS repeat-containing protein [Streptomyces sp. SS]|uniref:VCBS repeat-containing protein n=1 Tax=Streptomyces sp. SS TaxID=260742 RepID=UPI0002D72B36|nr:VCBS repeat-containing protein [Streptomyces sp. SS]